MNYTATFYIKDTKLSVTIQADDMEQARKIFEETKFDLFPTGLIESGGYTKDYLVGNLKESFKNQEKQKKINLEEIKEFRYNKLLNKRK